MDDRVSQMFFGSKKPKKDPNPHSKAYHRYFEDYIEKTVPKKNGGTKIVRIYAGSYYTRKESERRWVMEKVGYLLLFLVSFICYVLAGIQNVASNLLILAVIPQVLNVLCLLWLCAMLIFYAGSKRRMLQRTYRRCGFIRWAASCVTVLNLISAVVAVVCGIFWNSSGLWPELMTACLYLVSAGTAGVIWANEFHVTYDEEVSNIQPGENEYKIRA